MKYSRNNSVVFSRISVILDVGKPSCKKVSDGEYVWEDCKSPQVFGKKPDPKIDVSFALDRATSLAPLSFASQ
jgi:hypothetical protein